MTKTPVVFSVALPVRNGGEYLRAALDSVLAQSHREFELVVSDNASTDDTPQILAEYAAKDSRVRVFRSDVPLGHAENVNRSVSLTQHEWVKFICHDDLFHENCLSVLAKAIDTVPESVGVIGNGEEHLYANGVRQPGMAAGSEAPLVFKGRDVLQKLAAGRLMAPIPSLSTALVRRQVWDAAGRFDGRFSLFDIFLWTKAFLQTDYAFVGAVLTVNRIHSAQVAVNTRKTLRAVDDLRIFWSQFLREHAADVGYGFAQRLLLSLKPLAAAGAYIAIEFLKSRPLSGLRMFLQTPVWWWPVLPLTVARSYRYERSRLQQLGGKVPAWMMYPG